MRKTYCYECGRELDLKMDVPSDYEVNVVGVKLICGDCQDDYKENKGVIEDE